MNEIDNAIDQEGDVFVPAPQDDQMEVIEGVDDMDEDDGDDEDDEQDGAAEANGEQNGVLDGGVAEPIDRHSERQSATEADIILYVACPERIAKFPDHPILRPSVIVQIGLDKNTRLGLVFQRFVEYCNEKRGSSALVSCQELEFVHSELLNAQDKAEDAALMKNDRITVRQEGTANREAEVSMQRMQRDIDRNYFSQLQCLVPAGKIGTKYTDIELDCQGSILDESGAVQRVLSTGIRCHSVIVAKRCPWLGRKIASARHEQDRRSVVTVLRSEESKSVDPASKVEKEPAAVLREDEGEGAHQVMNLNEIMIDHPRGGEANQIENDDELNSEDEDNRDRQTNPDIDDTSLASDRFNEDNQDLLRVPLPDHSPDAVRVLLEYLYTNRVVSLGYDALAKAVKTKSTADKPKGPAFPFAGGSRKWPKGGAPTVSFRTAVDALVLAEEAGLPRLSLMCEIAASHLVEANTVSDALDLCESQKQATGNELCYLRRASMDIVLRSNPKGAYALPAFKQALVDRGTKIVPALFSGTAELVQKFEQKKKHSESFSKRDWRALSQDYFNHVDYAEAMEREQERFTRRVERRKCDPSRGPLTREEEKKLFERPKRKDDSRKRSSIKRMLHSLGTRASNRLGTYAPKRPHRRGSR